MQTHASGASFIRQELSQLREGPRAMARTLRSSYRALRSRTDVPKTFNRYCLIPPLLQKAGASWRGFGDGIGLLERRTEPVVKVAIFPQEEAE